MPFYASFLCYVQLCFVSFCCVSLIATHFLFTLYVASGSLLLVREARELWETQFRMHQDAKERRRAEGVNEERGG